MQSLGERKSSSNFLSRANQATSSHKFFDKRLSFKSDHKWKTCHELQRTFGMYFVIKYYWIGLTNNQKHKLFVIWILKQDYPLHGAILKD